MHRATPLLGAAADTSRRLRHHYIGSEHLLLAIAEDGESIAAHVLAELGLSPEEIRAEIVSLVGYGESPRGRLDAEALATLGIDLDEVVRKVEEAFGRGALERTASGCTPICPRLKRALERAPLEAGDVPLTPEQALLGLASVPDCVAAEILARHGIAADELRSALAPGPGAGPD
jgi:ATP-dependent Clp protease ATP-binding subunit ClpA